MLPFAFIPQPAEEVLNDILGFWQGATGSWGVAIILLTFTIRLAILPLTFKSVKSMQALQVLQPEMKKLQERYKGDKQRMNQEMMRFYQENKVNPLGSCLPLLLQIPFFIALFELLRSPEFQRDIEGAERFLFIPDLAEPLTDFPLILAVMMVLYVGTQLAASAVTMVSADPTQRKIMLALPFVFTLFIINFQAGLMVYWITTNVWTIGQQLVVRKLYPKPEVVGAGDDEAASKPARGKPVTTAVAEAPVEGEQGAGKKQAEVGKKQAEVGKKQAALGKKQAALGKKQAGGKGSSSGGRARGHASNGSTRAKPPPGSPRKKKKRSGRRR
ncbi:MAG: YidC/Oxa1 family membrane protein insertase [Thermoleophilaceae bacterium]